MVGQHPMMMGTYVVSANRRELNHRQWGIYKSKVYDLSDYLYTKNYYSSSSGTDLPNYSFLPDAISSVFQSNAGQDVTNRIDDAMQSLSTDQAQQVWTCLDNAFFVGQTDFRKTARCEVQNYILLALSVILCTVIGTKCEYKLLVVCGISVVWLVSWDCNYSQESAARCPRPRLCIFR
jgi:chitin synthase